MLSSRFGDDAKNEEQQIIEISSLSQIYLPTKSK